MRFDLSDDEWALLEPLMPGNRKSGRADDRKIMNTIFYVLRTGMPWRDLPERYGPYTTAYNRFNRRSRRTFRAPSVRMLQLMSLAWKAHDEAGSP
jgi:transposase